MWIMPHWKPTFNSQKATKITPRYQNPNLRYKHYGGISTYIYIYINRVEILSWDTCISTYLDILRQQVLHTSNALIGALQWPLQTDIYLPIIRYGGPLGNPGIKWRFVLMVKSSIIIMLDRYSIITVSYYVLICNWTQSSYFGINDYQNHPKLSTLYDQTTSLFWWPLMGIE